MLRKDWVGFFLYVGRVFLLLLLLAVLLPKLAAVCGNWLATLMRHDRPPIGNPLKVEAPNWSQFVIRMFSQGSK